jgi:hypothetical protein
MIDQNGHIMTFSDKPTHVLILARRRAAGYVSQIGIKKGSASPLRQIGFILRSPVPAARCRQAFRVRVASGFSCSQAESTPAHAQVTQTVSQLIRKEY